MGIALARPDLGPAQPVANPAPRFDIPSAPLEVALSRFAEISGVDVLYGQALANGRRSSAVSGAMTAREAIATLLVGTGLANRFTSPRSVVVFDPARASVEPADLPPPSRRDDIATLELDPMPVTAPRLTGSLRNDPYRDYAERAGVDIRRSLDAAQLVAGGEAYETVISTRVRPDGSLQDVRVLRSNHNGAHDAQIKLLLAMLRLTSAPPPNLPQPLIFDVRLQ